MWGSVTPGIKQVLRAAGLEVRFHPAISQLARLKVALRSFNIDLVMDVGANEGQFARELRAAGLARSA
jgi:hypothetical protein